MTRFRAAADALKRRTVVAAVMPALLAAACTLTPIEAYEGPTSPGSAIAVLHAGRMDGLQINGKSYGTSIGRTLELLPGKYWIFWTCHEDRYGWEASGIELQAGHRYSAKCTATKWHVSDIGKRDNLGQQQVLADETENRVLAAKYPVEQ